MRYNYSIMLSLSIFIFSSFLHAVQDGHHPMLPNLLRQIKRANVRSVQAILRDHKENFSPADIAKIHVAKNDADDEQFRMSEISDFCLSNCWLAGWTSLCSTFFGFCLRYAPKKPIKPILERTVVYSADSVAQISRLSVFFSYLGHYKSRLERLMIKSISYAVL